MTDVQTGTTERKSWKAEAEKEKARGDFYKSLIMDSLDAIKSIDVLLATKYEVLNKSRKTSDYEAGWIHYEDGKLVGWMLNALALDIKRVDADHNVGDCKREFYAAQAKAEEEGREHYGNLEREIERCTICAKNRKRSKLGFFTEEIQWRHSNVVKEAAMETAAQDLEKTKDLLK
jgi:hypothetical protein